MALVIFFVPDPLKGLSEMVRVVKRGGLVTSYTWDTINKGSPSSLITGYLTEMGFKLTRRRTLRFPRCLLLINFGPMLVSVDLRSDAITVERVDSRISMNIGKIASLFPNIQKILPVLTPDQISDLKIRIEQDLAMGDDGFLYQTARANAIVGSVV